MELIAKSLELSNQPSLTENELGERGLTWAEILFEIIPEDDLKPSFNRAFKDNDTTFPVNAPMIKIAFERIATERKYALIRSYQANASDDFQCEFCFNCGFCGIDKDGYSIPLEARNPHGVRKCFVGDCHYWERRLAKM